MQDSKFKMSNDNTQKLAENIAKLLQSESNGNDLSAMRASIEKINQRLDGIEHNIAATTLDSRFSTLATSHPSQQKYDIIEAIADEVFENMHEEKACTFEPNGKPCDHCSMCNSHGF